MTNTLHTVGQEIKKKERINDFYYRSPFIKIQCNIEHLKRLDYVHWSYLQRMSLDTPPEKKKITLGEVFGFIAFLIFVGSVLNFAFHL